MRKQFKITGLFYENQGYKFRKFLHIKKNNSLKKIPDLMVVMMNPGGSRPINGIENNIAETDAIPDRTQDQIMRIMINCDFDFARVLNLSDLREPKSTILYTKFDELKKLNISHSIFDKKRKKDFDELFIKEIPVIFAWGVSKNLEELAEMTINRISEEYPIGLKKQGFDFAYYHPLPQNYNKQKEWIEYITKQINSMN